MKAIKKAAKKTAKKGITNAGVQVKPTLEKPTAHSPKKVLDVTKGTVKNTVVESKSIAAATKVHIEGHKGTTSKLEGKASALEKEIGQKKNHKETLNAAALEKKLGQKKDHKETLNASKLEKKIGHKKAKRGVENKLEAKSAALEMAHEDYLIDFDDLIRDAVSSVLMRDVVSNDMVHDMVK